MGKFKFLENGQIHGDHIDSTGEYQKEFAKFQKERGQNPGPVTPSGKVIDEDWKKKLSQIIAEERIRLNQ